MTLAGNLHKLRNPERNLDSLFVELANAREVEALEEFSNRWPQIANEATRVIPERMVGQEDPVPESLRSLSFLAYLIRRLWVADEEAVGKLEEVLCAPDRSQEVVGRFPVRLHWRRGTFVYQPRTSVQHALFYLAQNSMRAKLCANFDCEHPYFLALRGNERYCSKACFAAARRQAKKAWWGEHGEDWRSARERLKRTKKH